MHNSGQLSSVERISWVVFSVTFTITNIIFTCEQEQQQNILLCLKVLRKAHKGKTAGLGPWAKSKFALGGDNTDIGNTKNGVFSPKEAHFQPNFVSKNCILEKKMYWECTLCA